MNMTSRIEIKQGVLEGIESKDFLGGKYFSFKGIPFAKPPIGNLRFKAPLPPEPWQGIWDATKEQEGCYSFDVIERKIVGKEDCLYLNVYTPQLPGNDGFSPKAVMVFIHGGGFISELPTSKLYGPDYIVSQDVLLVTISYRVGVLGFLSLEDTELEVPGNAALKDQVMALRWIKENIMHFGGNPENVTIFGESAGGASVHYLVLSPMAKGLFHRAILQSGTVMNPWASAKPLGMELAHYLGVKPKDETELLKILQKLPVEDLIMAQLSMKDLTDGDDMRCIGPIIEKPNKEGFLDEDPVDLMSQGKYNKVPILLGYTANEGLLYEILPNFVPNSTELKNLIPYNMRVDKNSYLAEVIVSKLKEFYFPNDKKIAGDSLQDLYTDLYFLRGIYKSTLYHTQTSTHPVYLYRFSMDGNLNLLKQLLKTPEKSGACHGDDLGYLFSNALQTEVSKDSKEYKGIMIMTHAWSNFAKMGNPNGEDDQFINVEWKPVTKEKMNCMELNFELKSEVFPDKKRMEFWDEIYKMKSYTMKY